MSALLPDIPIGRARTIPLLLALLSILAVATRLDLGFERERIGIRGPHVVQGGRLSIDLPPVDRLAGAPAALVLQLRGGNESTPLEIRFDGHPIRRLTLPPGRNLRVDAAVHTAAGTPHRLELVGAETGWRVREIEFANVHGFSRPPLSLVIVPRGRVPDRPLPWGALILIAVGLWFWRPRWGWPRARLPRLAHRIAVTLVTAALAALLLSEWLTPFRILAGPLTLGLMLAVLYSERLQRGVASVRTTASPAHVVPGLVILMAAAVLSIGVVLGSRSVGGADVYGYVSQADLLRQAQTRVQQPIAADVPWPDPDWTLAPLGYAPGGDHTIVPTYPPGLPLLIILFSLVFGQLGPFLVSPVCAAALVWLTYSLGARMGGAIVGLVAAACVATSPTVLFTMLTPMSDVPVAAFWTASLLLAYRRTTGSAAAAGLAAGAALLIRPNLVFLAPLPLLVSLWHAGAGGGLSIRRAAAFALASAPFALFIGWWFNELYGSPLRSGYGDNATLFAWRHVAENLATYPVWLWQTQGPLVFLAPLSPLLALRQDDRFIRLIGVALIGLVTFCYLLYIPFDGWWYLRFFIVAFPLLFILSADAIRTLAARFAPAAGYAALGVFAAASLYPAVTTLRHHGTLTGGRADQKYADVGRYARERLPPNAVVYSMQHSGTVRYYSDLLTLRWTHFETDWMDRSMDYWLEAGYEPIILLDDWEVQEFLERFGSTRYGALVAFEPARAACTHAVFVYRPAEPRGVERAARVPQSGTCQ